jgi:hypothetical protein
MRGDTKEIELYQRLDEVVHYLWDPIGASGAPEARDEYYSYLPKLLELLKRGSNENEIADYLGSITSDRMGLGTNHARDFGYRGNLN